MAEIDIDLDFSWPGTVPALQQIRHLLIELNRKVDHMSDQQSQVDSDVQAVEGDIAAIASAVTAIQSEIAALQASNPSVDLTGLNQAVTDLATATASVQGIPPAPAS